MGQDHDGDEKDSDKMDRISSSEDDANFSHSSSFPRPPPHAITREAAEEYEDQHHRGRQASILSTSTQSDDHHSAHDHQVAHSHSRGHSSVRSTRPNPVTVPRSQRRGLLARFSLVDEVTNAWDYPNRNKWIITAIVAIAGAAAPMGSAIVLPALHDIATDFHSTATVVNLSIAFYMLSMSIFPLWWSSFSETLGRRTIYVTSFALFLVFNVLSAISTSIGMFIAMRILSGGAAASVQAVGAGTIADVWEVKERGRAMGMFYLGPLCGPLLAPILGGVLAQELGWRSTQWAMVIYGGILVVLIVFCLPETLPSRRNLSAEAEVEAEQDLGIIDEKKVDATDNPTQPKPTTTTTTTTTSNTTTTTTLARTPTKQSVKVKSVQYLVMARRIFLDPLHIILYLQFPAVALLVLYASITFGSLYVLNISVETTFSAAPYHYSSIIVGLLYIPNSIGYFLSSILGGRWVDRIMHREARKAGRYDAHGRLKFIPEDRMQENAWVGAIIFPCSMLAYGWFAAEKLNVAAALVANFFFGVGSMLIFALVTTMLTEFLPRRASNGIALNNFIRNIFSCVGTIVTAPLIRAIGDGWLFTGLAVISMVMGVVCLVCFKRFGPRWRVKMDQRLDAVMGD